MGPLKPTLGKLLLALLIFIAIEFTLYICTPLYVFGYLPGAPSPGRCGIFSEAVYQLYGMYPGSPHPTSYWYIYLPLSYLASAGLLKLIKQN